ncbi:ubiquitin carboxyl-terminal hydrolase 14-like [Anneissia japonica]|uniref:ubiquitin carboxyl-terminal hydrolase 14-like n=1 Tax=Anneissia japonica TaxID=1529436 RepID=UPI0014259FB8|nr:ubiquitin carboxyl-terminal hydrolase 14-like [Anneissia japonica]
MPTFKVNIKWGREKFEKVECNTDESPELFKAQLFALSGVQPNRQKVMLKGAVLKDDDWGTFKLKDGSTFLMMGTADELPKEPVQKTMFVEDMSDQQLASALNLPAGLENLGNTCYLNSTLQCFRSVPELRESLKKFTGRINPSVVNIQPAESITSGVRDLFMQMDSTAEEVRPIMLLRLLHLAFPQFAERAENGAFKQQDANECWIQLFRQLEDQLPALTASTSAAEGGSQGAAASSPKTSFMSQYFGGQFQCSLKCDESEEEPAKSSIENFSQLSCFISQDVKYMHTGLKLKMEEKIEKNSPTLQRNAVYTKTSKISRLPAYLTVQFVRFYYKEKEGVNAKILKDVKFPMMFDAFDLCSEELQQKMTPVRDKFKIQEDKKVEEVTKAKAAGTKPPEEKEDVNYLAFDFEEDIGSNNSGYYQLQAVLTHQGRSSSSGHYVGWIHRKGAEWIKFDDDTVTPILEEDILKLSGGGDWHCAYVLIYGPKRLIDDQASSGPEKMDE